MLGLFRLLTFPIISLTLLILGNGLFSTFISVRLDLFGESDVMIGLVTSAYYAGVLAASRLTGSWIARLGHIRAIVTFSASNSVLILIHSFWVNPLFWSGIRFMGGLCMGGLLLVMQSLFLNISSTVTRGRVLSFYLLIFYTALSLGQLLLHVSDPYSLTPYCLASTFSTLAILPLMISSFQPPLIVKKEKARLIEIVHTSPKGLFGGGLTGMLVASIYGLTPIYGQEMGLSVSEVGLLMSVIIFGGLSMQWPLGKWANLFDGKKTLIFACICAATCSFLLAKSNDISWSIKFMLLWLFGGFSLTLYPLSMAYTCKGVAENQFEMANGGFLFAYGLGAIAGPLLAPHFMNWMGVSGLFYFTAALSGGLIFVGAWPNLARYSTKL